MTLKVTDRVRINDSDGLRICDGTIVNINECREPHQKYAVSADLVKSDIVFLGEKRLTKIKEEIK